MSPQILQNMLDAKFPALVNGKLPVEASLDASGITIGKVDQGAAGVTAWPVSLPATSRTAAATAATSSSSVSAGAKSVTFVSSSDWSGSVLGVAFPASTTFTITAPPGDTIGAIAFTRSAGTLTYYTLT